MDHLGQRFFWDLNELLVSGTSAGHTTSFTNFPRSSNLDSSYVLNSIFHTHSKIFLFAFLRAENFFLDALINVLTW